LQIKEKSVPLFIPLVILITGIISGHYFSGWGSYLFLYGSIFTAVAACCSFFLKRKPFVKYVLFFAFLFFSAAANYIVQTRPDENNIAQILPFEGRVEAKVMLSTRNLIVRVYKIDNEHVNGKVLLRGVGKCLNPGSYVSISGKFYNPDSANNPGQFDWQKYLKNKAIFTICDVRSITIIRETQFSSIIGKIRNYIFSATEKYLPENSAGVLKGVLLGNPGFVAEKTIQVFRKTGVIHVLAVSGLHVGLLLGIFFYVFSAIGLDRQKAMLSSLLVMFVYVAVVGGRPSAVRAAIMLSMVVMGDILGGRGNAYNSLCFAALAILIYNPGQLFTAGFLLSFLAVSGIIYLSPSMSMFLGKPLAVSLAAVLSILPVLVWNFNYAPLMSPVTNLLIIPLTAVLVALGIVFLTFSLFSGFLAEIYGISITYIVKLMEFICASVYNSGLAGVEVSRPSYLTISIYYLLLIFAGLKSSKKRNALIITTLLILGSSLLWRPGVSRNFISVLKAGDSAVAVIKLDKKNTVLITGKKDVDRDILRSFMNSKGIRKIKHVYMVHPVFEDMEGLSDSINISSVEDVFYSGTYGNEKKWYDFLHNIKKSNVSVSNENDIIEYEATHTRIVSPNKKYIDIRDNYLEIEFMGKNNIYIYAGGDIPDKDYDAIIVFEAYKPDWDLIRERCENLIIYIGDEKPPEWTYWIDKKGKLFRLE
jgi:competence protein ComEC